MAAARFFIDSKKVKNDGTAVIYTLVHISRKSVKIDTGVSVNPDNFDYSKGRIRGNSQKVKDDNLILDKCLATINDIFVRHRLQRKILTAEFLIREYHVRQVTPI